jgi:hypothetical protein
VTTQPSDSVIDRATTPSPGKPGFFWQKAVLVSAFLAICVCVQFIIRLDYGPDEPYHVEYIHGLATTGHIPDRSDTYEVHHPPVYYGIMAAAWKALGVTQRPLDHQPGPGALARMEPNSITARRVMRFMTSLIAVGSVLLLFKILAAMGLPRRWQWGIVCAVAGMPMFQYLSGVVNNDNFSIFYGCIFCLAIVQRVMARECTPQQAAVLGLLAGGCTLAKQSALFAAPLALWAVWAYGNGAKRLAGVGAFLACALLAGIWWPLHIRMISGQWFPDFLSPPDQQKQIAFAVQSGTIFKWPWTMMETAVFPDWSLGRFLPEQLAGLIVVAVLLVGSALLFFGLKANAADPYRRLQQMSVVALIFLLAGLIQFTYQHDYKDQVGGRFLMNGIAWMAVFLGASLKLLRDHAPDVATKLRSAAIAVPLLVVITDGIWWILASDFYQSVAQGAKQ